jgi:hypothetical protein
MKTIRLIILLIFASLAFAGWTSERVSAKAEDDRANLSATLQGNPVDAEIVTLTVDNQTGGSLFIYLNALPYDRRHRGPIPAKSYLLLAGKQGKNQFQILAGRYTYSIRSSNCGGKRLNTKIFDGNVTLGPYFCDK